MHVSVREHLIVDITLEETGEKLFLSAKLDWILLKWIMLCMTVHIWLENTDISSLCMFKIGPDRWWDF